VHAIDPKSDQHNIAMELPVWRKKLLNEYWDIEAPYTTLGQCR
jgi:hypothetical protein